MNLPDSIPSQQCLPMAWVCPCSVGHSGPLHFGGVCAHLAQGRLEML